MTQVIGTSPLNTLSTPTFGFSVVRSGRGGSRNRLSAVAGKLNLVSLMDIFTILVFFLMLNSGDVEVLQPDKTIDLPESTATLKPADAPVIKLNNNEVLFRDKSIVKLNELKQGESIPALEYALSGYKRELTIKNSGADATVSDADKISAVSIMSDGDISYSLLKRVLYACAQAGFRDIGLATDYRQAQTTPYSQ